MVVKGTFIDKLRIMVQKNSVFLQVENIAPVLETASEQL